MSKNDGGIWLIPLLSVLAIYYPVGFGSQPAALVSTAAAARQAPQASPQSPAAGRAYLRYDAKSQIVEYFGADPTVESHPTLAIDSLIATVPDPVESSLGYLFDRYLAAIQRAMEADDYVLDRFELPWLEKGQGEAANAADRVLEHPGAAAPEAKEKKTSPPGLRVHEREPGVVLFRGREDHARLLVLWLVGETPTAGIHKEALRNALNQAKSLEAYPSNICREAKPAAECRSTVRLLGPSFSGSADSLLNTVKTWEERRDSRFTIVSGSATAIADGKLEPVGRFSSMLIPDERAFRALFEFLDRKGIDRGDVAILTEGNTAFGAQARGIGKDVLSLTYPLHISQLRTAAEKARALGKERGSELPETRRRNLRLSLEEGNNPRDVISHFSPFETFSTELVLSNLLTTLARERKRYVGILSTDTRDQMFLAREIRKHAPNTVLFTFGADLLYLHSDVNLDFQGMLLFSTYPLFSLNQIWTHPSAGGLSRLQFPDHSSQGVYNAALELLDRRDLRLEYGSPFAASEKEPALWLSAVGNNDLWPIEISTGKPPDKVSKISETLTVFSGPLMFGLLLLAVVAAVLAAVLIKVFVPRKWLGLDEDLSDRRVSGWLGFCADAVFERHCFSRRAYLFCLALSVLILCLIGASVFARFLKFSLSDRPGWFPAIVSCVVASAGVWATILTIAAGSGGGPRESRRAFAAKYPRGIFWLPATFVATLIFAGASLAISLRSSPGWFVWASMFALFCFSTLSAVFAAFFIGRKLWVMFRQSPRAYKEQLPGALAVVVPAVVVLGLALLQAAHIGFKLNPAEQLFYHLRTVKLDSGLSPLVPLFFVAGAAVLWIVGSLRRVRMLEELLGPDGANPPPFLALGEESAQTLASMEKRIKNLLLFPLPGVPGWSGIAILVGVPCFLFFVLGLVQSVESNYFYWFFGGSFFLVYMALAFTALRFAGVWWQTRRLLGHMSSHRIVHVFKTLKENSLKMPKMDLSDAFQPHSALQFSFDQARSVLPRRQEEELRNILEEMAKADADDLWQHGMRLAHTAQAKLSAAACVVAAELRDGWIVLEDVAKKEREKLTPEESRLQKRAAFLAAQLVVFLHHVLSHLQNMIAFVMVGLLLMLLAINYYPFQPREWLLWFNWAVILATVLLAITVFVQMGRNRSLSLLSGSTPGQVTWNREFLIRMVLYVAVPVLALLGAQFPESLRRVLSIFGTANGVS